MIRQSERKNLVYCNLGNAYLSVSCNPGAVVVFHTPKACSHLALRNYWSIKRRGLLRDPLAMLPEKNNLFVTGISDKEAIFGGEKILRQCLLDISQMENVQYIVVVPGCTAGVIGDDVEAVCKDVEEKTKLPIIVVSGAGFMSKHYTEHNIKMLETLLERFATIKPKDREKKEKLAVIIGENSGAGNENNVREIKRLLHYFGFTRILFPPNTMTKEEFAMIPEANLILSVGIAREYYPKMQEYARVLAERYQTKCYTGNYPKGMAETKVWFKKIGEVLACEAEAKQAWEIENTRLEKFLQKKREVLSGKSYIFVIGYASRYFDPKFHLETLSAVGAELKAVVLHNDLTSKEKAEQRKRIMELTDIPCYTEEEIKTLAEQVDFVLTTTDLIDLPHQLSISIQQVGIWGLENLLNKVSMAIHGRGRRILYEY